MITLSVDENNDIFLGTVKNLAISSDKDALTQACTQATSVLTEELAYATTSGINYPGFVWSVPDMMLFESNVINALLSLDGVNDVSNFLVTRDGDKMNYTCNVHTIYGDISL